MKSEGTLILTRKDVTKILSIDECIAAVENVFRLHGEGKTDQPGILGVHATNGGFHIKAGLLNPGRCYFAAKVNANFPENPQLRKLPTIQGLVVLCDGEDGSPLAVMDSIELTIQRTGAATAVAARYLARPDSKTITICGCGNQGAISARALATMFPLNKMFAFDISPDQARRFATEISNELGIDVIAVDDLESAAGQSNIIVTCTTSRNAFLEKQFIRSGAFIAAVGSDSEDKQELDPQLLAENKVVVDVLGQCAAIGELHHALRNELMKPEDVYAELGETVAGTKPGRTSDDEIIIFDSTGMALQDVITASIIYERAVNNSVGIMVDFA